MLKDIIALVDGADDPEEALDVPLAFARLHQAHLTLTLVSSRAMLTAPFDPMGRYYAAPEAEAEHARRLDAVRVLADRAPIDCDVRGLHDESLFIPGRVDLTSRCADLVLIGPVRRWRDAALRRRVIDTVLLDASAATLLHPEHWVPEPFTHAVLGWNGSAEAARAARLLITMLAPEARIDIVMVEPLGPPAGDAEEPGAEIARHFERHRFQAELHSCAAGGRPVAEVLESFAVMRGAQLLAIGAYAHARLREIILGGTTRELIAFQRLAVLMSH